MRAKYKYRVEVYKQNPRQLYFEGILSASEVKEYKKRFEVKIIEKIIL